MVHRKHNKSPYHLREPRYSALLGWLFLLVLSILQVKYPACERAWSLVAWPQAVVSRICQFIFCYRRVGRLLFCHWVLDHWQQCLVNWSETCTRWDEKDSLNIRHLFCFACVLRTNRYSAWCFIYELTKWSLNVNRVTNFKTPQMVAQSSSEICWELRLVYFD